MVANYKIEKAPTDIYGLAYRPVLVNRSNRADHFKDTFVAIAEKTTPDNYFSYYNRLLLMQSMWVLGLNRHTGLIAEIGIGKKGRFLNTSTYIMLTFKHADCQYIGVDFECRNWVDTFVPNATTIAGDSSELHKHLGRNLVDLLLIDGGHSVDQVLQDWKFVKYVASDGIILMHDIKVHPGPRVLVDAIDTNIYSVTRFFLNREDDFGMAMIYRNGFTYANELSSWEKGQ